MLHVFCVFFMLSMAKKMAREMSTPVGGPKVGSPRMYVSLDVAGGSLGVVITLSHRRKSIPFSEGNRPRKSLDGVEECLKEKKTRTHTKQYKTVRYTSIITAAWRNSAVT